MRKIPRYYENPIDNIILDFSDKVNPSLRKMGLTPNMLTTYSFVAGILGLYFLWKGDIKYFIIFHVIGYVFDCMDGHMARTYNMVTKTGDLYDHITDYIVGLGILYIIIMRYGSKINIIHTLLFITLFSLMQVHIGCQQKYYKENKRTDDNVIESLDMFSGLCKKNEHMKWTRFFGTGTITIVTMILIYVLQ